MVTPGNVVSCEYLEIRALRPAPLPLPVTPSRHARLFELIRQDNLAALRRETWLTKEMAQEDSAAFAKGQGVSDHPDRGFDGQMLRFQEPGYDPFEASVDALCDHWGEWRGMVGAVAAYGRE